MGRNNGAPATCSPPQSFSSRGPGADDRVGGEDAPATVSGMPTLVTSPCASRAGAVVAVVTAALAALAHALAGGSATTLRAVHRRRRPIVGLVASALALAAVVLGAPAAQAHNVLQSTDPAAGSTVPFVPEVLSLTFNEPVLAVGTTIIVRTSDETVVSSGPRSSSTTPSRRPSPVSCPPASTRSCTGSRRPTGTPSRTSSGSPPRRPRPTGSRRPSRRRARRRRAPPRSWRPSRPRQPLAHPDRGARRRGPRLRGCPRGHRCRAPGGRRRRRVAASGGVARPGRRRSRLRVRRRVRERASEVVRVTDGMSDRSSRRPTLV